VKVIAALSTSDKIGGAELIFKMTCTALGITNVVVNNVAFNKISIKGSVGMEFSLINRNVYSIINFLFRYIPTVKLLLKQFHNADVVYVNDFRGLFYLFFLKPFSKARIYYHCHSTFRNTLFNRTIISAFINHLCAVVIVPSDYLKNDLDFIGIRKISKVYNGIKRPSFKEKTFIDGIGNNSICRIGIFGAINDQKGQDVFVSAIEELLTREFLVEGHIVGYTLDEQYAADLKRKAGQMSKSIVFHGELPHIEALELLNEMDIIVCASKYRETLPTVLLEAMSLQKPVIGTNIGGIPEIIAPEENGLLVHPENKIELANSAEKIIKGNLFNTYGLSGFLKFQKEFSLDSYINKMKILLDGKEKA